jgi:hypothetical protein
MSFHEQQGIFLEYFFYVNKIFIHMDYIFLPHRLHISSIWIKYYFWSMKYFVHVDEKYHHIIGEKRARSGHKFWIFRNVELTKEIKWHPLKTL